jgi:hypothetical protein
VRGILSGGGRALAVLVVLAACLPYLPTVDDYFTQDDFGVVQLLAGKPWTTFPRWFTMPWMEHIWGYTPDEIRPFVAFTYQVTALAGAARPELHHLLNIALHAANALLVMALARRAVGLSRPAAAFAAVSFALLPVAAESVAWITGRVDSMPAFFYLATVLAYVRWRQGARFGYAAALLLFFVALFSKQNTITMVATLASYDVIVARRRLGPSVVAWLPFALLTGGYLLLRRLLFGASVRGGIDSREQVASAAEMIGRHLLRTVAGHTGPLTAAEGAALLVLAVLAGVLIVRQRQLLRAAVAFGPLWWIVGAAPVLVAGYESPRHVYLAAAGWAFMLGVFWQTGEHLLDGRRRWRQVAVCFAAAIPLVYAVRLSGEVHLWGAWARVSRTAVEQIGREAAAAPPGTLLLVSVPRKSWEWATPFVLQPPYSAVDLSARIHLVTPARLHCCGGEQWSTYTRAQILSWAGKPAAPVIALHFPPETGSLSRTTDSDRPELRLLVRALAATSSWQALDANVIRLTESLATSR